MTKITKFSIRIIEVVRFLYRLIVNVNINIIFHFCCWISFTVHSKLVFVCNKETSKICLPSWKCNKNLYIYSHNLNAKIEAYQYHLQIHKPNNIIKYNIFNSFINVCVDTFMHKIENGISKFAYVYCMVYAICCKDTHHNNDTINL